MPTTSVEERNKKLVAEFYDLAINQRKPTEAAAKYIGHSYRQHNPEVRNGPASFIQFIQGMFEEHPGLQVIIHRALADGPFVALHVHLKRDESDLGLAVAEVFRL